MGAGRKQNGFIQTSITEKASYGIASAGGNIITQILGTFLSAYLTDSVGIAVAAVGTMMLVARFFDGASDIIMGGIIDRTKTRWGKARPWLLVSAPLILITLVLTFSVNPQWSETGKLVYAYLTYISLNCISFTVFMVSHTAMLSRITLDGNDRQKMASINQILNQVGALAVTTFMVALVGKFGWSVTALIYGIAAAVCILIGFFFTREYVGMDGSGALQIENVPLKKALPAMLKNKYFYMLTLMFILILMQAAGPGSMTYYYCNYVLNNLEMVSFVSACSIVPAILANLFVPALAKKFGRRNMLLVGALGNAFGYFLCGVGTQMLPLVYAGMVIKGFFVGFLFACGFAMASDVVDYGEWKTGVRSEGLINSCVSFGQKVGLGLGPAIASWVLAMGGFDGMAAVQSEAAVGSINFCFSYYGVILSLGIAVIAFFMDIDRYADSIRKAA